MIMNVKNMLDEYIKIELQHANQSVRMASIILKGTNSTIYMRKIKCNKELQVAEYCVAKIEKLKKFKEVL